MDKHAGRRTHHVNIATRASLWGYGPLLMVVVLAARLTGHDAGDIRFCVFMLAASWLMAGYVQLIRLVVDERGVTLRWPLLATRHLGWDRITQVRRGFSGRFFHIDLIASPDECVTFNPFMFDNPRAIIEQLDEHLRFDREDQELFEEVLAAESRPAGIMKKLPFIIAAAILTAIAVQVLFK